jgi:hypothetical protein
MNTTEFVILLKLLVSHILADFFLQPSKWVEHRNKLHFKTIFIYLHASIAAGLALLLLFNLQYWWVFPIILITHSLIDGIKSYLPEQIRYFLLDQAFHLVVLFAIWLAISETNLAFIVQKLNTPKAWLILSSYLFILSPTSILIGKITSKLTRIKETTSGSDYENSGRWIGWIERLAILSFILFGHFEAIGFLVAAKSIFRYGDIKNSTDKIITQYVLIGSLLSFSIAIFLGLTVNYILKLI